MIPVFKIKDKSYINNEKSKYFIIVIFSIMSGLEYFYNYFGISKD